MQSPNSQDDFTPSPYRSPVPKSSGLKQPSRVGQHIESRQMAAAGQDYDQFDDSVNQDTDFKDSALGEEEGGITEAEVREMELTSKQMNDQAETIIEQMESLIAGVMTLKEEADTMESEKQDERTFLASNDILKEKKKELDKQNAANKEVKLQINHIKKTFQNDSNYEWMNETENRIKSDKKILSQLKNQNAELTKMHDKHEKILMESDEAVEKKAEVRNMQE